MESLFVLVKPWQFFACVFLIIFASQANASSDTGITWLKSQQQADGSFSTDLSLADSHQATTEVLIALNQHKALDAQAKTKALAFLGNNPVGSLESNVNALRINKALLTNLPVSAFKEYSGYNGGFGDYSGYDDSIYATAQLLASIDNLVALQEINGSAALGFLLSKQRSDNAWSEESNNSSVVVTAQVNRALQQHRLTFNVNDKISTSSQYLIKSKTFFSGWNSVLETAQVLLAVIPAASTPSAYEASVQYLINAQLPNGSWNHDPYTTAIALQVLYLIKNPPAIENKELGSIAGTLKSNTIGLPIDSARIDIAGPSIRTIASSMDGYFNAPNLLPGEYLLKITATGYQQVELKVTLGDGAPLNVGAIQLQVLVDSGVINGRVTNLQTGEPLANVDLVLLRFGGGKYLTSTDGGGFYSQEVIPGQYSIGFALTGYYTTSKTLYVGKGTESQYSPQLSKLSEGFIEEGYLYGTVNDPTSFAGFFGAFTILRGIEGVVVRETIGGASTITDENGWFKIAAQNGLIKIVFEKNGFETKVLDGVFNGGADTSAGSVLLTPINGGVFGKVIDAKTGIAVPYASIKAENVIVTSDELGSYKFSGTKLDKATVVVSAAGYETQAYVVPTSQNEMTRYDFPLKKIILSQIELKDVALSSLNYDAYENVTISAKAINLGEEGESFSLQARILNSENNLVAQFALASSQAEAGESYSLEKNEQQAVISTWNTAANKPGKYRVIISIYSDETSKLLNEYQSGFVIVPSAKLAFAKVFANVSELNQGQSEALKFIVSLRNQSNIPVDFTLNMLFLNPQNGTLYSLKKDLSLKPDNIFASFDVGSFDYTFAASGIYRLQIAEIQNLQVAQLEVGVINVSPNIKIDIGQSLIQSNAFPEKEERIKVKIRLEGREEK